MNAVYFIAAWALPALVILTVGMFLGWRLHPARSRPPTDRAKHMAAILIAHDLNEAMRRLPGRYWLSVDSSGHEVAILDDVHHRRPRPIDLTVGPEPTEEEIDEQVFGDLDYLGPPPHRGGSGQREEKLITLDMAPTRENAEALCKALDDRRRETLREVAEWLELRGFNLANTASAPDWRPRVETWRRAAEGVRAMMESPSDA